MTDESVAIIILIYSTVIQLDLTLDPGDQAIILEMKM